MDSLTEEELATFILMTHGESVTQIAHALQKKLPLARGLASRVYRKLGVRSRRKAATYGRDADVARGLFA